MNSATKGNFIRISLYLHDFNAYSKDMRTLFTLLFFLGVMGLKAQVTIEVKIESRPSSLGVQPAFEVMVPQATAGDAIDLWKKTILPGGLFKKQPKMDKVKDEWIVNNVLISDITSMPLNVFTQVNAFTGNIFVRVFLQTDGGFLGSYGSSNEATTAASGFIRNYAVELYRQAVAKELKQEEKKLTDLENDLSRLQRQNKNFGNKITDAQKDEKDLKNEVLQNEELLRNQQNVIQVENTNPGTKTVQEQLEKQVKETEKDLEKTQKSQFRYDKKLSKNDRDQKDKIFEIDRQKGRVAEVRRKLDNIR
jgi:hypothetical protein